jgi:hypothetical protein
LNLEKSKSLCELSVQLNFIDDVGMASVSRFLANSLEIQSLNFGYNHIGPGGVRELMTNLGKLESLSLEGWLLSFVVCLVVCLKTKTKRE